MIVLVAGYNLHGWKSHYGIHPNDVIVYMLVMFEITTVAALAQTSSIYRLLCLQYETLVGKRATIG